MDNINFIYNFLIFIIDITYNIIITKLSNNKFLILHNKKIIFKLTNKACLK